MPSPHAIGDEWWEYGVDLSLVPLPFPAGHDGSLYGSVQYKQRFDGPDEIAVRATSNKDGKWYTCTFAIGYGGFDDANLPPELVGCAEQAGGHAGVGNDPGMPEDFAGDLPDQPGIPATQFARRVGADGRDGGQFGLVVEGRRGSPRTMTPRSTVREGKGDSTDNLMLLRYAVDGSALVKVAAAARQVDAELRSRGEHLMLPLDAGDVELLIKVLNVSPAARPATLVAIQTWAEALAAAVAKHGSISTSTQCRWKRRDDGSYICEPVFTR